MSAVQSHVAFILDGLAKKAVAEIITLFDNTFAAFIEELCKKQNEIDQLKKRLESPQTDVNTAGNTMQEMPSVMLSNDECSLNHQTAREENDLEPKSSSPVITQWDFPDEQQYDFEGISDGSQTLALTQDEGQDTAGLSEDLDDCSRSEYGDSKLGVLEFELKAAQRGRLTEEEESGTRVLSPSQASDVPHTEKSTVPGGKKAGRRVKVEVPEMSETATATKNSNRKPAKENRRKRKVKGSSNTTCSECKQSFARPNDLVKHRFSHKQKQLLSCEWCGITFPFKSQMVYHVRIHTGERPFRCDMCDRGFISKGQLKAHRWYHKTKEKGEFCSLCGADSLDSLEGYTPRRRSSRVVPCAKCGKTKSGT